jgi:hypothetical protein
LKNLKEKADGKESEERERLRRQRGIFWKTPGEGRGCIRLVPLCLAGEEEDQGDRTRSSLVAGRGGGILVASAFSVEEKVVRECGGFRGPLQQLEDGWEVVRIFWKDGLAGL